MTFATWTGTKATAFRGRQFVPVRPRVPLLAVDRGERWVERAERAGIEVRVTTVERTVADVLDRPSLAGGIDEVWRSLFFVRAVDPDSLLEYVKALGSRTLAAKIGFFLDCRRQDLVVTEALMEWLRSHIPRSPVYMDRTRRGRLVTRWSLVVPPELQSEHAEAAE